MLGFFALIQLFSSPLRFLKLLVSAQLVNAENKFAVMSVYIKSYFAVMSVYIKSYFQFEYTLFYNLIFC